MILVVINGFDTCGENLCFPNLGDTTGNHELSNLRDTTTSYAETILRERIHQLSKTRLEVGKNIFGFIEKTRMVRLIENTRSEYALIKIDKSDEITEMMNSDNSFFLIHEEINTFVNYYFLEEADSVEATMYVYRDREVEGLESIFLSIKIKGKDFGECLDIWEDFEKRLRDRIARRIYGSPASRKRKLIEINRKLTIKIDNYD